MAEGDSRRTPLRPANVAKVALQTAIYQCLENGLTAHDVTTFTAEVLCGEDDDMLRGVVR